MSIVFISSWNLQSLQEKLKTMPVQNFGGTTKNVMVFLKKIYRVFSHDVTAAILVYQNNETATMLVSQTSPLGVELFSHANAFVCYNKFA